MDDDVPAATVSMNARTLEHRWVVGVDGSECSRHAALWAARQSRDRVGEVQIATSWSLPISVPMSPMGPLMAGASFDALESAAHRLVKELAAGIAPTIDAVVTTSVGQGGAAGLLLEAARHASLLVVGSRGRGGFGRLVLGSTSTQCATHADVPVAVIPATSPIDQISSIVVAFDGSANSVAALQWANAFATPGTTIDCVSVWDTTPIAAGADRFFFPEASELAEERSAELVSRTIRPIERPDVDVRHSFVNGRPRTVLADHASSSDLLVMGGRGHGAVGAALLGSVSTWLLHHHARPMVVVPVAADAAPEVDAEVAGGPQ